MLSLSAVIVKIIGLIYKIPMLRLLGSEGMGYFNSAYEIYALFCSVATTGLPVAMAVMISSEGEGKRGAGRIFRAALRLFLILGAVGCALMLIFARPFASFLGNASAAPCLAAIAPCVLLICVSSAYRGYFQGKGRMAPTAISQTIEALGKLILGLILASVALMSGLSVPLVAAFAVMGLTLGEGVSALYLAVTKRREKEREALSGKEKGVLPRLLATAVPVTLSSLALSVTKVVDMSMILRRLQDAGESARAAFSVYGSYTTLAIPLFSVAPALVSSVAMPLIPSLSEAVARGDVDGQKSVIGDAMRMTAFVSMPISLGLTLFSRPILSLIFSGESEAIAVSAPLLSLLALSVTASCFITVGNAILQAYRKAALPIVSMVAGSILKIILAYFLIGNPKIGILGAPISTFFCDAVINGVNFFFISRLMPSAPKIGRILICPFISATVAVTVARVAYNAVAARSGETAALTVGAVALAAVIYVVLSFVLKVIGKKELSMIPVVGKRFKV